MSTAVAPAAIAAPYPTALRHFPVLRQSLLAEFSDCQLQAGFDLRMAIPKPGSQILHTSGYTTHRQSAGRLIHSAIGGALRHMAEEKMERIAPESIIGFWERELRQADMAVSETFALPAHEDALARRTLRKWARDNAFTIADIYGIEERLTAPIRYPDGAGGFVERILTGQMDLLLIDPSGAHATVPDWKDTWKLPSKKGSDDDWEEEDEGDDALSLEGYFQQRFYALLIFLAPEFRAVQSVTLREFYVRRSKPREATIWRHELPALLSYFAARAEAFDRCYEAAILTRRGRVRKRVLATPAQWGEPSPGAHCFSGDTRILTSDGIYALSELRDKSVCVLNRHGEWEDAHVRSFGRQALLRVSFDAAEPVLATAGHRWWQTDGFRVPTVEAEEIPIARHAQTPELDEEGIRHGIVYGDGTVRRARGWAMVDLQPHKAELARYFDPARVPREHYPGQVVWHEPVKLRADGVVRVTMLPTHYKELPGRCSPAYARGFIAGLIATDGSVGARLGDVQIHQEGRARALRIAELARLGGAVVSSVRLTSDRTPSVMPTGPVAIRAREMMAVRLKPLTAPVVRSDQAANLKERHQMRRMYSRVVDLQPCGEEEVFCAVVPDSESFTLANGLVTSNCSYCPGAMDCPVPPEAREGGMARTAAEAATYAGIMLRAQRIVKMCDATLRTWVDREGPIRVKDAKRDHFFGYVESERVERPSLKQVEAALLAGRDPRTLYRRKTSTRYTHYRPDADVTRGLSEDDVVAMFERAAELAARKR